MLELFGIVFANKNLSLQICVFGPRLSPLRLSCREIQRDNVRQAPGHTMLWDACPCNAPGHSHNQTPHTHPDSRPSPSSRLRRADQFGAHRPCSATRERPHLSPHAPSRASSQPRAAVVPRGDGGRPGNGGRRPARRRLPLLAGGRGRHPAGAAVEADSHLRRRRARLRDSALSAAWHCEAGRGWSPIPPLTPCPCRRWRGAPRRRRQRRTRR